MKYKLLIVFSGRCAMWCELQDPKEADCSADEEMLNSDGIYTRGGTVQKFMFIIHSSHHHSRL